MASPFTENLLEKISEIQLQIDSQTWSPTDASVVGVADKGAVRVRVRDDGTSTTVHIHPDVDDPRSVEKLERLVAEAIEDASVRLHELRTERVSRAIRAMIDDVFAPALGEER
jgi:DNA-binding protein YbaB